MQGDHKIILQRIAPPVLPPQAPEAVPAPPDPESVARWQAARREAAGAPLKQKLLAITATAHDGGLWQLQWWHHDDSGVWQTFEAWSYTDFRSLWMVQDFEVNDTRYIVFPAVRDSSPREAGTQAMPAALRDFAPGTPDFVVTQGNPADAQAINPVTALHKIYETEGPQLQAAWEERERLLLAAAEWRKANPPKVQDTIIQMWPVQSRRYPVAPAAVPQSPSPAAQ